VSESAVVSAGPMQAAFVRDVNDPSQIRVSIGGTLALSGLFGVAAGSPEPESITPASGAVAYALTSAAFGFPGGVLRVQMTGTDAIRMEAFPGAVADPGGFTAAARVYVR
jgi:hypothetical protein